MYFVKRKEKDENLKEFIKEKGWKVASIEKHKGWYWTVNVKGKDESFYYIRYYDKSGKLHKCSLFADWGEEEFKIMGDDVIEES